LFTVLYCTSAGPRYHTYFAGGCDLHDLKTQTFSPVKIVHVQSGLQLAKFIADSKH